MLEVEVKILQFSSQNLSNFLRTVFKLQVERFLEFLEVTFEHFFRMSPWNFPIFISLFFILNFSKLDLEVLKLLDQVEFSNSSLKFFKVYSIVWY